ncbi:MAG: EAL domain-containing protein [Chloroflexota bacterium]
MQSIAHQTQRAQPMLPPRRPSHDVAVLAALTVPDLTPAGDRLGRSFPLLLVLTIAAAGIEAVASRLLHEPALGAAAASTGLFALGVVAAGHEVRAGRPVRARIVLATTLTVFGALGALMVPGVGAATALVPVVSVVLVLPHVPRSRLMVIIAAAVAASVGILVIDQIAGQLPAIGGLAGAVFEDSILIGVVVLVLAGVADFAMDARDSLQNLHDSVQRQLQVTAARLSIVAALRTMHTLETPEATAASIANALSELPLVAMAVVLEAAEDGLYVLTTAGSLDSPIHAGDRMPTSRAAYLLGRSRDGAWAELWANRPVAALEDAQLSLLGIKGQAFAPILAGDDVVGLVCIGTTDCDQADHLVADLPSVSEAAAVASAILAPALLARRQLTAAKVRIAATIAAGAFHPVFQPIVDLDGGEIVGFEALTRFANGEPPATMFADAARAGLGHELEAATLVAAMRDGARLPAGAWLSLNVSPALLAECSRLTTILAHRTRPIVIEITEHEVIVDYAPLHTSMRALGSDVRLAVDDAGAGAANFQHLVDLRPNIVKIDAGLIRGVNADVSRQALIVGLVHFGAMSGALVLAEGIETEAEQATAQRLGITLGQGYRLARPAPIEHWTTDAAALATREVLGKVIPIHQVTRRA